MRDNYNTYYNPKYCTYSHCDFDADLYPTADWCIGNFRSPSIKHWNKKIYVAIQKFKPGLKKNQPSTCSKRVADEYSPQLQAYLSRYILVLSSRQW